MQIPVAQSVWLQTIDPMEEIFDSMSIHTSDTFQYKGNSFEFTINRSNLKPEQIEKLKIALRAIVENAFLHQNGSSDVICEYNGELAKATVTGKRDLTNVICIPTNSLLGRDLDKIKVYADKIENGQPFSTAHKA